MRCRLPITPIWLLLGLLSCSPVLHHHALQAQSTYKSDMTEGHVRVGKRGVCLPPEAMQAVSGGVWVAGCWRAHQHSDPTQPLVPLVRWHHAHACCLRSACCGTKALLPAMGVLQM